MSEKVDLNKYIVNVQGKDFITFPGLLAEAHSQGLVGIETTLVNPDSPKTPIVKAVVTLKVADSQSFKMFTGYGDATETNVAKKVVGALLRMAETRAIARALRFACNIDMTAIEELDADNDSATPAQPSKGFSRNKVAASPEKAEDKQVTNVAITSVSNNGVIKTESKVVEIPKVANDTSKVAEKFAQPQTATVAKPSFARRTNVTTKSEPNFP